MSRINPVRLGLCTERVIVADAEALAANYTELGVSADQSKSLPCPTLLEGIATGLAALFGDGAIIGFQFCADDMVLAPERRRAVILIASEHIINALKYAFPNGRSGSLHISLLADHGTGELVVEDDGVGVTEMELMGSGSGLIDAMTKLLGGDSKRVRKPNVGTRCSVIFPLTIAE